MAVIRTLKLLACAVLLAAPTAPPDPASKPVATSRAHNGSITVTPPEDSEAVLRNPDMGWVLYENYPVDPRPGGSSTLVTLPGEDFPGVGHVAVMFSWADVEREP